jgi:hypothetical protein
MHNAPLRSINTSRGRKLERQYLGLGYRAIVAYARKLADREMPVIVDYTALGTHASQ